MKNIESAVMRLVGIALVGLGLVFNKWLLEATVVPDGRITSWRSLLFIAATQVFLIGLGVGIIVKRPTLRAATRTRVFLLIASLCLSIVLAEGALRLFFKNWVFRTDPRAFVAEYKNRQSRNFIGDRHLGWRMRPGVQFRWGMHSYLANKQGFRSPYDFDTVHTRPVIAIVGDSFSFGTGVEYDDTFGALLDDQLPEGVVLNFALPGYGIDQMWMMIRHEVIPRRPDFAVVAFVDQDFARSLTAFRPEEGFNKPTFELDGRTNLRPQLPNDRPPMPLRFIEKHSALWNLINASMRDLSYRWPVGEWWVKNVTLIEALVDEAQREGIPVVVVRIPNARWRPFPSLAAHLKENGVPYLDLGDPRLRAGTDLHIERDGHINVLGHAFVALHLMSWLDSTNVLELPHATLPRRHLGDPTSPYRPLLDPLRAE